MATARKLLYGSPNGDRWFLARDPDSGRVSILHEPTASSGGGVSDVDIGTFLTREGSGPERRELLRLIGTLIDEGVDARSPRSRDPD